MKAAGFKDLSRLKKGSIFVEAAMVFPLIVLTLALIISFSLKNYHEVKEQTDLHNDQRQEAMEGGVVDKNECEYIRMLDLLMEKD